MLLESPFLYRSIHSTCCLNWTLFLLISSSLICAADRHSFLIRRLVNKSTGARVLRVFLPAILTITFLENYFLIRIIPQIHVNPAILVLGSVILIIIFILLIFSGISNSLGKSLDHTHQQLIAGEEKYRILVEESPYCVHNIDLNGNFMSMNLAGLKMMHLPAESDIIGEPYLQFIGERDRGRIQHLLENARRGLGSRFEFEGADGRYYSSSFTPSFKDGTHVVSILGITEDITLQRETEHKLKLIERENQAILNTFPYIVFRITRDGTILDYRTPNESIAVRKS